ncbi:uncharacterized protein LOC123269636 [Cotesia glomerata]|uniref:uncharacterized protein LOC123269636 n=1 Tax=Cotesia glomerata TaxID=32391 RepID=UPI001D02007B|nr:uncharacterized protein LOC123269636 [Cotesia glomerata]
MDHLNKIHSDISSALSKNLQAIVVSLDIEKAYDMAWVYRVIEILTELGLNGHIIHFLKNFLTNRKIHVRIGSTLSHPLELKNGFPQGSVLSTTLFLIAINPLISLMPKPIKTRAFADDISLICTGKINTITDILQDGLNKLTECCKLTGFKFSSTKSEYMVFSRLKQNPETNLSLGEIELQKTTRLKLLGITFDPKLTWKPHVQNLHAQCKKRLNILKALAANNRGASKEILTTTYKAVIRSKMDYGATIYGSAAKSTLKPLDSIQTTALRVTIGAFRTSPRLSILAESGELPLLLRRTTQILKYIANSPCYNKNNPFHNNTPSPIQPENNKSKKNYLPINDRLNILSDPMFIKVPVHKRSIHPIPPWELTEPQIDLHVYDNSFGKEHSSEQLYKDLTYEMYSKYNDYIKVFTDGSVKGGKKGCAIILNDDTYMYQLPEFTTIFSCEVIAIDKAIDIITQENIHRAIILTDSKSALEAIANTTSKDPRVKIIQSKLHQNNINRFHTVLAWVPSHQGLQGNEEADQAAKTALTEGIKVTDIAATPDEFKNLVNTYIWAQWNGIWMNTKSLLHQIRQNVWEPSPTSNNRRTQYIRLETGDMLITLSKKSIDKGQALRKAITGILQKEAEVMCKRPQETIEIRDIDDDTTKEDIQNALKTEIGETCEIPLKAIKIRKAYRGTQTATVTLPAASAQQLPEENGKIRIGWVNCQIRATKRPIHCFKCWHFGSQCKSEID